MNKQIKQWGEGLIKDWLNDEQAPGKKNLHNILSEPLLEELISYNDTGNFDRVMALMQVMIYREQLYNLKVKEKKKRIEIGSYLMDQSLLKSGIMTMISLMIIQKHICFNYEKYQSISYIEIADV